MTATTLASPRTLTARQVEVLQAVADGDTYDEIATALWITRTSVSTTVGHIRVKLRTTSTASAVAIALRKGLIT